MRLLAFLIFTSALLLGMAQSASACSCLPRPTVLDEVEMSDEVVIVRVVSVEKAQDTSDYRYSGNIRSTSVIVEKVFKGKLKVGDEIVLGQGNGANCVYSLGEGSIGHQFLFYLRSPEKASDPYMLESDKGFWLAYTCGRSKPVDDATEDLLYLENMKKLQGKTRISGTIRAWQDPDLDVGGKKIKIIGPKKTYATKTDANGVFEIYDLPPGKYFLEPEPPRGWKMEPGSVSDSASVARNERFEPELRPKQAVIILEPKKHASVDIALGPDNFVRGRVVSPKGKPMNDVCVHLLERGNDWGPSDCTDQQGRFEITSVSAGEYVLVANQDDKPSNRWPFRRVFYPGVLERERAAVVIVGPGDVVENLDLVIPALKETITVTGVLLYSDGSPVAKKSIKFKVTKASDNVSGDVSELTDSEGRFTLKILKGLTGELAGEHWVFKGYYENCPKVDELIAGSRGDNVTVRSNVIKLTTEQNVYNVELTLPFPHCEKAKP